MHEADWGSLRDERGSYVDVLGIDISKADFHACLLQEGKHARRSFPNTTGGYRQLLAWLRNRRCTGVHACMEATGAYWLGLAQALAAAEVRVSVVNPNRTAMFARSQLRRTKTDVVDAEMIAQFCKTQTPSVWTPPAPETLELRALLTYREHLVEERTRFMQLAKQLHGNENLKQLHEQQTRHLNKMIAAAEQQLRALIAANDSLQRAVKTLTAVKGFGLISAASLLAKLPVEHLRDEKAASAYAGLTPSERQSGTSIHGKPRICKTGNSALRKDLYMPAVCAMRHNPILAAFAQRLSEKGKPPKVIIVAIMRKLVVLAYRLLKRLAPPVPIAA
jgi:transposase